MGKFGSKWTVLLSTQTVSQIPCQLEYLAIREVGGGWGGRISGVTGDVGIVTSSICRNERSR